MEYRKSVVSELVTEELAGWTQRKKKFILKDEVDFKPQSTAHLMKWQNWDHDSKLDFRYRHTATVLSNQTQVLFFGGLDDHHRPAAQTVKLFDCLTNSVRHLNVMGTAPKRRTGHTATLDWSGNRIVIIGGSFSHGERCDSVDVLHGVRFEEGEKLRWNTKHAAQWHLPNESVVQVGPEYTRKDWCGCHPSKYSQDNYNGQVKEEKNKSVF